MFNVGDLVKFKDKGVAKRNREHPDKTIALVIAIERDQYWSYTGEMDDRITVQWMPLGKEESMPEFLLEKVTENA
jgi:hypothetical protein